MNRNRNRLFLFLTFLVLPYLFCAIRLSAQETYVEKSELPAAVRKTAEEQSRGAFFKCYRNDKGIGRIEYGIELTTNGYTKYVTIDPEGHLLEVEEEISLDSLPPAVRHGFQQTIGKKGNDATIKSYKKDVPNKKLEAYEVEMITNGRSKLVVIDLQGNILEIDQDLRLDSLPPVIVQGIRQAAGKGTIHLVKGIIKRGTLVAYEAQIITAGKYSEIQVGQDGKVLDHRE